MTLMWSNLALADLDDIYMFIFPDNPERAITFVEELQDKADTLINYPMSGVMYSERYGENVRELHYKGYSILYEIMDKLILVHEVYNQAKLARSLEILK